MMPRPPRPPLFPYTTLFRSIAGRGNEHDVFVACLLHGELQHRIVGAGKAHVYDAGALVDCPFEPGNQQGRSEEHTSELQSQSNLVCRLLLEKKKVKNYAQTK